MAVQTRIVDVYRKPSKCPVCGESVVDIIYGTGDMTEIEFFLEYRRPGIMREIIYLVVHLYGHVLVDASDSVRSIQMGVMLK